MAFRGLWLVLCALIWGCTLGTICSMIVECSTVMQTAQSDEKETEEDSKAEKSMKKSAKKSKEKTTEKLTEESAKEPIEESMGESVAKESQPADPGPTIRILLSNGSGGEYFSSFIVTSQSEFILETDSGAVVYQPGYELAFTSQDEYGDKIRIYPKNSVSDQLLSPEELVKEGLIVTSMEKRYGCPIYPGTLELHITDQGICVVNETCMEQYLCLVVSSELLSGSPMEAMKAQAVCARTYAGGKMNSGARYNYGSHVTDTTACQVYNQVWYSNEVFQAVEATAGQFMCCKEALADSFFFSTSWGYTAGDAFWNVAAGKDSVLSVGASAAHNGTEDFSQSQAALEAAAASLPDVTEDAGFRWLYQHWQETGFDFYDQESPWFRWTIDLSAEQVKQILRSSDDNLESTNVTRRGKGGIVEQIVFKFTNGTRTITGSEKIRQVLGTGDYKIALWNGTVRESLGQLPSSFFYLDATGNGGIRICGGGFGHGCGLSQYAACHMAQDQVGYKDILRFFYKNVEIVDSY